MWSPLTCIGGVITPLDARTDEAALVVDTASSAIIQRIVELMRASYGDRGQEDAGLQGDGGSSLEKS